MERQKRESAIVRAFSDIGKSGKTAFEPVSSGDNRTGLVDELHVSYMLYALADKRREQAKADALAAGVLGDFDKLSVGSHLVFNADGYAVTVKRNNASETLDKTLLRAELVKRYGIDAAEEIIKAASKERKGQTTVVVSLEG